MTQKVKLHYNVHDRYESMRRLNSVGQREETERNLYLDTVTIATDSIATDLKQAGDIPLSQLSDTENPEFFSFQG